jgi:trehalose 6-phosphate synthase/phosphatase
LKVFNAFLERNAAYRGKVILILRAVPPRAQVEHYRLLKKQVDKLVNLTANLNLQILEREAK